MDQTGRAAPASLTEALRDRPYEFDFFQAVRRLECAHPDLPRVGCAKRPHGDLVRFSQKVSLCFEPVAVTAYDDATEEHPSRLAVSFLGLLGTNGPMPLSMTEYVYERLHNHKDSTLACFLDMFNHRVISLFYRAWACSQQTVSHDRTDQDRFACYIGSLFGMGLPSTRDRDVVPDVAKLYYSGRLCSQPKNAEGLREVLQDYFGLPVTIEEFVEQWIDLPAEYRCRLGSSLENAALGSTSIVGSRFMDRQQKFRVRFGPMGFSDYQRLLPGGASIGQLVTWIKNYVGDELSWELNLVLRRGQIPVTSLGELGQLGWSVWLGDGLLDTDADDLVLLDLCN